MDIDEKEVDHYRISCNKCLKSSILHEPNEKDHNKLYIEFYMKKRKEFDNDEDGYQKGSISNDPKLNKKTEEDIQEIDDEGYELEEIDTDLLSFH